MTYFPPVARAPPFTYIDFIEACMSCAFLWFHVSGIDEASSLLELVYAPYLFDEKNLTFN